MEPNKAAGWTMLGRVLLEKGNSEAAQDMIRRAVT
ncbi:MAG: cytochrome C biogenesis protein, partial [Candidatus Thorarchaeota archaeon]|nr:cytochrome C biogenesis protein [Candidatus Thorarchaeota archaeon]